jgi:2-oxoglutarate dehydrogenase E2 component (dihydrolipoamide succinyltransferase)
MGTSVSEGTVVGWSKQVGETVERDEPICEISTDKIDTDCPAPASGVVAEILVEVGTTVDTGTVLARIATGEGGGGLPMPDRPVAAGSEPTANGAAGRSASSTVAEPPANGAPGRRYSPVVKRMGAAHGIDLAAVPASGRNGRVTKKDVEAFLAAPSAAEPPLHSDSPYRPDPPPAAAPAPAAAGVPVELSRMRQSIATAMRGSLATAATCTTIVECDMTLVERHRRQLGLTALPLVARHTIDALREFPDLNATLEDTTFTRYDAVHLGMAVSLGGDGGLIVPVIHDAHQLTPEGIAARTKDLATRAREKRLTADDVQGGTFTITSPGAFGAIIATPIINVPQVAILDLEAIVRRPVVVTDADGGESIAIRSMAYLCLSWDHRAIDGAYAARFLTALRKRIESDPLANA